MPERIPGPKALPVLGNILDVAFDEYPLQGLERLADIYGEIYQFKIRDQRYILVSSAELLGEVTDEKRFLKDPPAALKQRKGAKGLFAAENDDPDWGQAHRILTPAFGPMAVEGMFNEMKDLANQLVLKWARRGPSERILVTDDFTRLTLDTIALTSMDYRFNSFYQDKMHPFVDAMLCWLKESGDKSQRGPVLNHLLFRKANRLQESWDFMTKIAGEIIANRRAHPTEKQDLLNAMIYGVDPKTGERMRDELIISEMITFLVAGHETTSGLLSFVVLNLCRNSEAYLRAQREVDEVIGSEPVTLKHLKDLKYLNAVLRETMRLTPTAPLLTKHSNPKLANQTVLLGGKYKIEPDDLILALLAKCHQDPKAYGDDAKEFRPERMLDEKFDALPSGTWMPFGNGSRACIGRSLAWQEALLAMAMILQNFDFQLDDPAYEYRVKFTLTIKPKDLYIRATLRPGRTPRTLDEAIHLGAAALQDEARADKGASISASTDRSLKPMKILFGSNTGTCQSLAQRLASEAAAHGFTASIDNMDSAVEKLPRDSPVILITSSYEGQPPDNAARFMGWLETCTGTTLAGVNFAVFGCGHKDWAKTFQRVPILADELLAERGARRLVARGTTDVSAGNVFGDFDDWAENSVWPALSPGGGEAQTEAHAEIDISTQARATSLRHDVTLASVIANHKLTVPGEPEKWHMEIQLPTGSSYECGDYLAVLPINSDKLVKRIMARFEMPWDAVMTVKEQGPLSFPTNSPLSVYDILRSYVELSQPATKKDVKRCLEYATSESDKTYLESILSDASTFETSILKKRISVYDLLCQHPDIHLPFGDFLACLPPMCVRQYSISSSPLVSPETCTITYGVISAAPLSNPTSSEQFEGVTGTYMSTLKPEDRIQCSLRPTAKKTFRLPLEAEKTPLLMFGAGTGLAPFRGFLQQRAIQHANNPEMKTLAPALLFLGCRSATKDRLYADEMDEWIKQGVVDVRYAFSQEPDDPLAGGCKYVADRMVKDAKDIVGLWQANPRMYVCGSRRFAQSVDDAAIRIIVQRAQELGKIPSVNGPGQVGPVAMEKVKEWYQENAQSRTASDVFD